MKKVSLVVVSLVILLTFLALAPKTEAFSSEDIDCVGTDLAKYVANVFQALEISAGSSQNSLGNIKFLSPAFNMTEADFPALVEKFNANNAWGIQVLPQTAGSLPSLADALAEVEQQHLRADDFPVVVEDDALDVAGAG